MTKYAFTTVCVLLFLAGSGCSSLPGNLSLPSWGKTSSPTKITAFWEPVIRHEGETVIRGFAANVMFYDLTVSKKALRVRGNFDIYAYDEDNPGKDRIKPTRIIQYQVDNLKNLESTSKMFGKSYTIWVPWDEITDDSRKKNISLIVRFRCDDGTMVMSQLAKVSLPGMMDDDVVEDPAYVNPYADEKEYQLSRLQALAEGRYSNTGSSFDTVWKNSVAEHIVSHDDRPQAMTAATFTVPTYTRDGAIPNFTPQRSFASATDEQKYLARQMIAESQENLRPTETQWANNATANTATAATNMPNANVAMLQNPNSVAGRSYLDSAGPYHQVQYQSLNANDAALRQALIQPAMPAPQGQATQGLPTAQPTAIPSLSQPTAQPVTSSASQPVLQPTQGQPTQGLAPMNDEAKYREFLNWKQQQAVVSGQ